MMSGKLLLFLVITWAILPMMQAKGDLAGALEPDGRKASAASSYHELLNIINEDGLDKMYEVSKMYIERHESLLGEKNPTSTLDAKAYSSAGVIMQLKGDYDRAHEYFGKALEIRESLLGEKHPLTASSFVDIGNILKDKGDLDGGLENFKKALEIDKSVLGEKHPDTAKSYWNVGTLLYAKKDLDGTLEHFKKALVILESALGTDHEETVECRNAIRGVQQKKDAQFSWGRQFWST